MKQENIRKPLRLEHFDYNDGGMYFLTLCTKNRVPFLSRIRWDCQASTPQVRLLPFGRIAFDILNLLPTRFSGMELVESIIMPDHIHLLVYIPSNLQSETRSILSQIISYLKMNVSKQIHSAEPFLTVWQRGYYDHVIRNQSDMIACIEYIRANSFRWLEKRGFPPI